MRRSRNAGSQPVRNLFTNPGAEGVGAAITIRTNLAMDPSATAITQWSLIGGMANNRTVDNTIFHEGNSAVRFTATAAGQPGAKCAMSGVIASGETVSWSMWVYSSVAVTIRPYWERTAPTYTGGSGSTVDILAATWTKLTYSYTFNVNQADPAGVYGFGFLATTNFAIGDYIVCDEILIEKTISIGTWFNGSTASSGDFTYAWSGTANASSSLQKAIPPNTVSMQNCLVVSSTDWAANGSKSFRIIPGPTASTDTSCNLNISLQNKTYTLLATCRVKAPQTGSPDALRARRIQLYFTGTGPSTSAQAPNAVGVYPLSVTFTITDSTQFQSYRLYNGASAGNGDIWWDNVMLVEGAYTGDYINPTVTPFSKWDGTANASTSVGYAPQLYDIAGKPDGDISGVVDTGTIAVSAFAPRTIYVCYEATASTVNYPMYASYGVANTKGIDFQASPIGQTSLNPRIDFPGGTSNMTPSGFTSGRTLSRHVAVMSFNNGLTSMTSFLNGGTDVVTALTPGSTGWDDGRMKGLSTADGGNIRMLVYYAEHDRNTKLAISRYLGNKYGAFVA